MKEKSSVSSVLSPLVCLAVILGLFSVFAVPMGLPNMFSTLMNTAFALLSDTCFYIMAVAVIMGAFAAILTEFGVVDLLNRLLSPLMEPIYGLPGAAALGIVTTYMSDNPAILPLAEDRGFRKFFKEYQLPALTNIGTAFGMGLIISTYMLAQEKNSGTSILPAVLIGNLAAVIGSIVSTRLMLRCTKRTVGRQTALPLEEDALPPVSEEVAAIRGPMTLRALNALMSGGKKGVQLGLEIIPGILVICTFVMMLTNKTEVYTGAAYEGIGLLPALASRMNFLLQPLFGFGDPKCISVPITALGSAGAAMSLVPQMLSSGAASVHDVAVFTAMCMCWSGYLGTHVTMMNSLGYSGLTSKAILSHTAGGLCAGIAANWLYTLFALLL